MSPARLYARATTCDEWTADIWDNRVVPSFIDSKQHPLATPFFHHEDTACYKQVRPCPCSPYYASRTLNTHPSP